MLKEWIDLSMPIEDHIRWKPTFSKKGNFDEGDIFEASSIEISCHSFTHMDAQRHVKKNAKEILDIPTEVFVGRFYIIDISKHIQDNLEITASHIQQAWVQADDVDRIIFKTCWDAHYSPYTVEYWSKSPYLHEDAVQWLSKQNLFLCAFDFPQDYPIRKWTEGIIEKPLSKHFTHKYLLKEGVTLVEYIINTASIHCDRVWGMMTPIAVKGSDGAPCRVLVCYE